MQGAVLLASRYNTGMAGLPESDQKVEKQDDGTEGKGKV
jgi:hypothetical protein